MATDPDLTFEEKLLDVMDFLEKYQDISKTVLLKALGLSGNQQAFFIVRRTGKNEKSWPLHDAITKLNACKRGDALIDQLSEKQKLNLFLTLTNYYKNKKKS